MKNLLISVIVASSLATSGCKFFSPSYCQSAANANGTVCKAERTVEQCGPGAAQIFIAAIPYVMAGNYQQAIDLVMGAAMGSIAECIKDAIDTTISQAHGPTSSEARTYRSTRHLDMINRLSQSGNK